MNESQFNQIGSAHLIEDINNAYLPPLVYKYRTIQQVQRFLGDRKLYFATPSEFNDPFEGKFYLEESSAEARVREQVSNQIINNLGVFCVGTLATNIIMWSHYCEHHKGATIEFDMRKDPEFFAGSIPVQYHMGYPRFHHKESQLISSLQHKFQEWQHEYEVRVIKLTSGLRQIKPEAVSSIIFGVKTTPEDIEKTKQLAAQNGWNNLQFKQCIFNDNDYLLDLRSI